MRKFISTLLFICIMPFVYGQFGRITQITMNPVNPTANDTIYLYVDYFLSSHNIPDINSLTSIGNQITVSATHCLGITAMPSTPTDTFELLPMPSGNYVLNMELRTAISFGPGPCVPAITPDTTAVVNFSVGAVTGMESFEKSKDLFEVYPNPSNGQFTIRMKNINDRYPGNHIKIIFADGRLVKEFNMTEEKEQVTLSKGIYFLQLMHDQRILTTKRIVVVE